jgi:DNA-binding MarR family transcriptional regulator
MLTTSPTPSATDVASHLRLVVARTARRLRQEAGADLSPSLTSALASIDRHGPLTPSELAGHERVQRPTATRLLTRLTELGLVERAADPADRRSALISTSAAGRALLRRLRTRKNQYLAQHLAALEPDELATLDRAAAILERMLDLGDRR